MNRLLWIFILSFTIVINGIAQEPEREVPIDSLSTISEDSGQATIDTAILEQSAETSVEISDDTAVADTTTLSQEIDSVVTAMNAQPPKVGRTVQKNLGKDGVSARLLDYRTWNSSLFLVVISLLYFYWVYRLGHKTRDEDGETEPLSPNEPLWIPLLKACIFFLVLLPFASFFVSVIVLEASYLLILIFLYLLLFRELSAPWRQALAWLLVYFVVLIVANLVLSVAWWSRVLAVLVNILGILFIWYVKRPMDIDNPVRSSHRYMRWIIIVAHVLAVVCAVLGYINLARMWGLAAAIGLVQIVALRAIRDILLRDIEDKYHSLKPEAVMRRFDLKRMLHSCDRLIRFCSGALIILVWANNLYLAEEAYTLSEQLLVTERKIGGITFTYANLFLAVAVIWLANWFQRNLKNLIDDTSPKNELQVRKLTLFPLFRLLIVIIGFLIGISILGLGLDKLTVIIGALSVGIGLGLQNVINNFVSGIILVFEKPFKIGDYVELADKKGQVMEIGIRSSTLLTDEGARVIIPNGDLLSGRLVNWTFVDSDIRVNLTLTVDNTIPIEEFKEQLRLTLSSFQEVDPTIPMKIFTKEITADNYKLTIQVGIRHIRYIERFRSKFLEGLKKEMDAKQVKLTSG